MENDRKSDYRSFLSAPLLRNGLQIKMSLNMVATYMMEMVKTAELGEKRELFFKIMLFHPFILLSFSFFLFLVFCFFILLATFAIFYNHTSSSKSLSSNPATSSWFTRE